MAAANTKGKNRRKVRTKTPSLQPKAAWPAMVSGLVLLCTAMIVFFAGLRADNAWLCLAGIIPGLAGGYLFSWGKRQRQLVFNSAQQAVAYLKDYAGPIYLYLRPFELEYDSEWIGTDSQGMTHAIRIEHILTRELRHTGRLLAIGSVDNDPAPGAYRIYSDHDSWWEDARRLLSIAALIILRPGAPTPPATGEAPRGILREITALPEIIGEAQSLLMLFRHKEEHQRWSTQLWPMLEKLLRSLSDAPPSETRTQLEALAKEPKDQFLLLVFHRGQVQRLTGNNLSLLLRKAVRVIHAPPSGIEPLPGRYREQQLARLSKAGYIGFILFMVLFWGHTLIDWYFSLETSSFLWLIPSLACLILATISAALGGQDPDVF